MKKKNNYDRLRTKLERAYELDDAAFKARVRELLYASMKGNYIANRYDKTEFIIKWAHTIDDMISMLKDIEYL
jgi:hypothetical protein